MAYGRRTMRKRTYKRPRRRFKRRIRRNRRTRSTVSRMPTTIVPDRLITRLRVVDTMLLTGFYVPTTTNTLEAFSFKDVLISVGNPFSVYGVVSDDVPAGLKTWANFYNEVATISARVKVTPVSYRVPNGVNAFSGAGAGMPYSVCLCPMQTGNPIDSSVIDFMEQPYRRYKYFTQAGQYNQSQIASGGGYFLVSAQSGNSVERSVVNTMTSKKILAYKDIMDYDADPPLWIDTNTPQITTPWGFVLTVKSAVPWDGNISNDDIYTLPDMFVRIEVTYTLMFRDRKPIADDV